MNDFINTTVDLIKVLARADQNAEVYIDNRPPTALSSYRGYYEDLAIERADYGHEGPTVLDERPDPSYFMGKVYVPGHQNVYIKTNPTVGDLMEALYLTVGEQFEGYKGGQFTMTAGTRIWVSEYGQSSGLQIFAVEYFDGRVDFLSKEVDLEW